MKDTKISTLLISLRSWRQNLCTSFSTVEHGNRIKLSTKRKQLTAKTNAWQDNLKGDKTKPTHGETKPSKMTTKKQQKSRQLRLISRHFLRDNNF